MPKKKSMYPSIFAEWTEEGPVVSISDFGSLSPVKLERCFEALEREWFRLRDVSMGQRRQQELDDRIGADDG